MRKTRLVNERTGKVTLGWGDMAEGCHACRRAGVGLPSVSAKTFPNSDLGGLGQSPGLQRPYGSWTTG